VCGNYRETESGEFSPFLRKNRVGVGTLLSIAKAILSKGGGRVLGGGPLRGKSGLKLLQEITRFRMKLPQVLGTCTPESELYGGC